MKTKILILFWALGVAIGYAQTPTKVEVESIISDSIPNNTSGLITPSKLRSVANSILNYAATKPPISHTHTTSDITDWVSAYSVQFATKSTDYLSEGANKYYTDARVQAFGDTRYLPLTGGILTNVSNYQLRLAYDATNYLSATVNSTGSTTFQPTGTNAGYTFNTTGTGTFSVGGNSVAQINTYRPNTTNAPLIFSNSNGTQTLRGHHSGNWLVGQSSTDNGNRLTVEGSMLATHSSTSAFFQTTGTGTDVLSVQSTHNSGFSTVGFLNNSGTTGGSIGHRNSDGKMFFFANNRDMFFYTSSSGSGSPIMTLKTGNGNILINTNTDIASSIFTIQSTTKGFLPPRMTAAEASAIAAPAEGLMLYVTNTNATFPTKGWYGYNGTIWEKLNN